MGHFSFFNHFFTILVQPPIHLLTYFSFDPFSKASKSRKLDRAQSELRKLKHKSRREMKGARKEIRQDTQFVARLRAKEVGAISF